MLPRCRRPLAGDGAGDGVDAPAAERSGPHGTVIHDLQRIAPRAIPVAANAQTVARHIVWVIRRQIRSKARDRIRLIQLVSRRACKPHRTNAAWIVRCNDYSNKVST